MHKKRTDSNVSEKFKAYVTGIMLRNFISSNKIDKYFRMDVSDSMSKAIEENWIRILGIDFKIISLNMSKSNQPLGIALEGRNVICSDSSEVIHRHYLKAIMPIYCIGSTNRFMVGDELLEVNGLKIYGMKSKDVVSALKKLPNNIQMVVARSHRIFNDDDNDNDETGYNNGPISFYDMNEDISSRTSTLKSNSSLFSTTSRDYGSTASVGDHFDGHRVHVSDYLRDIIGWRGPIVLEFRKEKHESLGLALEEIKDPKTFDLIIVFKVIVPEMRAAKDGRLHVGDRLLHVNGKSVIGTSFRKVCQWMKSSPGGRLILYICKPSFPTLNFDSTDYSPDNYLCNTLLRSDKLSKLSEEPDKETTEIPPVPESLETHLVIKRSDDKLGLFLDIYDNGKNGCRIKKIIKGRAKDNGILHEGDFITTINGISMRLDEKNKLEHCLRIIAKSQSDYHISFFTKEDVEIHNSKYTGTVQEKNSPNQGLYPNPAMALLNETSESSKQRNSYDQSAQPKLSFETYSVTIENDHHTNLGLILSPSLNNPNRYVSITDIHPNSLADKPHLLKINDELLSVNNASLEQMTPIDVGMFLKKLLETEDLLRFKVKRLICADDDVVNNVNYPREPTNRYCLLSDLPDMYFCTLKKTHFGYGISVKELTLNCGVVVNEIESDGSADNIRIMKPGHRFVMINNSSVCDCSLDTVIKMVKNSQHSIALIMETPKFREFNVTVVKDANNSLGLNVGGGIDTKYPLATIESIVLNSSCNFSEKLEPEDLIVEVNGSSMTNVDHETIIQILRGLPKESDFKIWRKLPLIKRNFSLIETPSFFSNYLQSCQFSVIINKPVSNIRSFGIVFGDLVIPDPLSHIILDKYKVVISVEKGSLVEKYAPEVTPYCYLIGINDSIIDVDLSCDQLTKLIDSFDRIELLFSRDIPYRIRVQQDHESLHMIENIVESSNNSSISVQDPAELELTAESHNKHVHFGNPNTIWATSVSTENNPVVNDDNLFDEVIYPESQENVISSSEIQFNGTEPIFVQNESISDPDDSIGSNEKCSLIEPNVKVSTACENLGEDTPAVIEDQLHLKTSINEDISDTEQSIDNSDCEDLPSIKKISSEDERNPMGLISMESEPLVENESLCDSEKVDADQPINEEETVKIDEDPNQSFCPGNDSVVDKSSSNNREIISEDEEIRLTPDESYSKIDDDISSEENCFKAEDKTIDTDNIELNNENRFPKNETQTNDDQFNSSDTQSSDSEEDKSDLKVQEKVDDKINTEDHQSVEEKSIVPESIELEETVEDHHNTLPESSPVIEPQPIVEDSQASDVDDTQKSEVDDKINTEDHQSVEDKSIAPESIELEETVEDDHDTLPESSPVIEPQPIVENSQASEVDDTQKSEVDDKNSNTDDGTEIPSNKTQFETDLGIIIDYVLIPKIENTELGFQVIGGIDGGPDGETLPIYVVGVERNTCNWPANQNEPSLTNGTQLLDLNGRNLAAFDLLSIEKLIASTEGDLKFKVIKIK